MMATTKTAAGGYDGYLFDLDGTLVDSAPDYQQAAVRILQHFGLPPRSPEEMRSYIGDGQSWFIKRILTGQWWEEPENELFSQARKLMKVYYEEVWDPCPQLYPGVREGLHTLANHYPLACVTSKPEKFTPRVLTATKLDEFFSVVVSGDTLDKKKPDPKPLLFACEKMNISPARALMVGDSPADAKAAAAAGCDFFVVRYGHHGRGGLDELKKHGLHGIIDSIAELAV